MYALIGTWRMCLDGARRGTELLRDGADAGDAVERAIMTVEDEPGYTSVGYGGLPDRSGHVMLDAAYMDGRTLRMGGVISAENIRNPIALARKLCGLETNCLLAGRGAEQAAVSFGLPMRDMRTEASMAKWRRAVAEQPEKLSAYQGGSGIHRSSDPGFTATRAAARRPPPAWERTSCGDASAMRWFP